MSRLGSTSHSVNPDVLTGDTNVGTPGPAGPPGPAGTDGLGWTSGSYNAGTGVVTFTSDDGLGFTTGDLRGADGADGADGTLTNVSLAFFFGGLMDDAEVLSVYVADLAFTLPSGLTTSQGHAGVGAAGATVLDLQKNGVSIGSVNFAAAASTPTFTLASATSFVAGDRLSVHAPGTADTTLSDVSVTLRGNV